MKKNLYSVVFQDKSDDKILYHFVAESLEEAFEMFAQKQRSEKPEEKFTWRPVMWISTPGETILNAFNIESPAVQMMRSIMEKQEEDIENIGSKIMSKIISSKDKDLFEKMKVRLTKNEIKLVKQKCDW